MPSRLLLRCAGAVLALGFVLAHSAGQTFAAPIGTAPILGAPIPEPRPSLPQHPRHGDETLLYAKVRNGVYSVDGLVGKLRLNYDVQGQPYMYLFAPGLGTAVISANADPDSVMSKATLREGELRFFLADHIFTLTGLTLVTGDGRTPQNLYVRFDRQAWHLSRLPMVGYGKLYAAPYEWPGAGPAQVAEEEKESLAPPVPTALLPSPRPVKPSLLPISVDPAALRNGGLAPGSVQ